MTAGSAASRRVLARTPVAPLPASQPNTPDGHHRENVRSARDVLPRSVQFLVATNVRFSVAIDTPHDVYSNLAKINPEIRVYRRLPAPSRVRPQRFEAEQMAPLSTAGETTRLGTREQPSGPHQPPRAR